MEFLMTPSETADALQSPAPANRRPKRRQLILGIVVVGLMLAVAGWVLVSGSSDRETLWSSGFSCRGDGEMARESVDHAGPLTGEPTPELAVDRYTSGPGTGLPASGYHECQRSIGSARGRTVDLPAGGHQNCPVMASRTARG